MRKARLGVAYLVFFCGLFCFTTQSNASFAQLVHNRFYYIKRLERIIPLLVAYGHNSGWLSSLVEMKSSIPFCHHIVQEALDDICQTKSIKPIERFWEHFSSYRYINDILFLEESIKLVALVSLVMVVRDITHESAQVRSVVSDLLITRSLWGESLLVVVQACSDYLNGRCHGGPCEKAKQRWDQLYAFYSKPKIDTDNYEQEDHMKHLLLHIDLIAERFYLIQRVGASVDVLQKMAQDGLPDSYYHRIGLLVSGYTHEMVVAAIQEVSQVKDLQPFFYLWNMLDGYEHIDDELLVKESVWLCLALYKELFVYYSAKDDSLQSKKDWSQKEKQAALEYVVALYQIVERLPLNEILDAIDILVKELPILAQHCQIGVARPWRDWLKKYWWMPPFVVAALAFKFLKRLAFGKLGSYFSVPRPNQFGSLVSIDASARPTGSQLLGFEL